MAQLAEQLAEQLTEQSLLTSEICGSNPYIGKSFSKIFAQIFQLQLRKDKNKEKEAGIATLKKYKKYLLLNTTPWLASAQVRIFDVFGKRSCFVPGAGLFYFNSTDKLFRLKRRSHPLDNGKTEKCFDS